MSSSESAPKRNVAGELSPNHVQSLSIERQIPRYGVHNIVKSRLFGLKTPFWLSQTEWTVRKELATARIRKVTYTRVDCNFSNEFD
jgi:hypothetical protein